MAKFSRSDVIAHMESCGIIPLFYHSDFETVVKTLDSCYEGGARILEFTNRGENAPEIFQKLEPYVRRELPEMMLGVGSVLDAKMTTRFLESGADFVVSPILNEEMAEACNQHNVLWSPGCGTLTEIIRATELGAEIVKVFPGNHFGPGFIIALKGPCPWLKLMPTGGVTPDNLSAWFEAGATCVGMGSKLIKKEFLSTQNFEALTQHIADTLELAQSLKKVS